MTQAVSAHTTTLTPRPPVVTVLGHIDHGKTTLLDRLRRTDVARHEAGAITQSITGSGVTTWQGRVTFVDTPGHEAFDAMRRRGASFTDLVLLIVAATEGVQDMTRRVADLARQHALPLVVAVTKIDAPGADPTRARQQLLSLGIVPEELGGDTLVREVSALTGHGIDDLIEAIALQAMMLDARADPAQPGHGFVLDTMLDPQLGPRARVIVRDGTVRVGDRCQCGNIQGWVRVLLDDNGSSIQEAPPSTPVDVLGLPSLPPAGASFQVIASPHRLRDVSAPAVDQAPRPRTPDEWQRWQEQTGYTRQRVVLRAPSQGAVEALRQALEAIHEDGRIEVVGAAIGHISERDIKLADAAGAVVLAMGVPTLPRALSLATQRGVILHTGDTIYSVIEAARALLAARQPPRPVALRATITHVFRQHRDETILGVHVDQGPLAAGQHLHLAHAGSSIESVVVELRRFRDPVKTVPSGTDCGLRLSPPIEVAIGQTLHGQYLPR